MKEKQEMEAPEQDKLVHKEGRRLNQKRLETNKLQRIQLKMQLLELYEILMQIGCQGT